MAAYLIVDIDIHNAAGLEEYRKQVPATVTKYGGRFIVGRVPLDVEKRKARLPARGSRGADPHAADVTRARMTAAIFS
jgi:hypothetical protein